MPVGYIFPNYIYDFSHLFLFTLAMYFMYKQNWLWYIVIFSLAILNKETAIMLTVIFIVYFFDGLRRGKLRGLLITQILIFLTIKSALYFIFQNNPGAVVESHFTGNMIYLNEISNYFRFEAIEKGWLLPLKINIPLPHGFNLPLFILTAFFVIYGWKEKPAFLRKAMFYFPLIVLSTLLFGIIYEFRSYNDTLPILYLLGAMGVYSFFRKIISKTRLAGWSK
jgi:hypothetical protein